MLSEGRWGRSRSTSTGQPCLESIDKPLLGTFIQQNGLKAKHDESKAPLLQVQTRKKSSCKRLQAFLIISCAESCHCFDRAHASFKCTTCVKVAKWQAWTTLCARSPYWSYTEKDLSLSLSFSFSVSLDCCCNGVTLFGISRLLRNSPAHSCA